MAQSKVKIDLAAINATPGILPPNTEFESHIGQNVINISNTELNEHQLRALEKGLTFCHTPRGPDKSEIWNDVKEFHRRLQLAQFLKPTNETVDQEISHSIIGFMNQNDNTDQDDINISDSYNDIHKSFKNKSSWRQNPTNKTLDTFKRAFKMNLLQSNIKKEYQPEPNQGTKGWP